MEEKEKRKQIAKISIFVTSIFIIFLSVTYAFINQTLIGTKRQVITAGNLSLELQEDENNLTITDAMPMYDEVGMIQEAFTFRLVNKVDVDTNYIVKLEKIIVAEPLDESLVKYGLTKDEEVTIDFVSNIEENTIDSGTISGNQTISYSLRLWIDSSVEDESLISSKSLSYKLNIEASQNTEVVQLPPATNTSELVSNSVDLGESCKTYNDGVDTFLVGQCQNNYVWYSGKLWRVVLKNNETGSVKMITDNPMTAITNYNFRLDEVKFENSYMDQWLNQEFLPTLHDYEDYLVVNSIWDITEDSSVEPTRPKKETTINRTVGLLNTYEYYTTYNNSNGIATPLTGYLYTKGGQPLITPYLRGESIHFHSVGENGLLNEPGYVSTKSGLRPSVIFKPNIEIVQGTGTIQDPYRLVGDEQETIGGTTLLNTRYSGEYIIFNKELYRIVEIEDHLTKIIAVNSPTTLQNIMFHNSYSDVNFANSDIKNTLEEYYQSLSDKNLVETNTMWYLGRVVKDANYKAGICSTIDDQVSMRECPRTSEKVRTNIGLPRVGEMFAVNMKNVTTRHWTLSYYEDYALNDFSTALSSMWAFIDLSGGSFVSARPSMYLKSTVRIARNNTGDGTYDNPYDIELGS